MFLVAVLACIALAGAHGPVRNAARPFQAGYYIRDPHRHQQAEVTRDHGGAVAGRYGYRDARGIGRQVNYVADHAGLRARVHTNEPAVVHNRPALAARIASDSVAAVVPSYDSVLGYGPRVNGYGLGYDGYGLGYDGYGLGYDRYGLGYDGYGLRYDGYGLEYDGYGFGYDGYDRGYDGYDRGYDGYGLGYDGYELGYGNYDLGYGYGSADLDYGYPILGHGSRRALGYISPLGGYEGVYA